MQELGVLLSIFLGVWLIMVVAVVWISMKVAVSDDKDEYLDD